MSNPIFGTDTLLRVLGFLGEGISQAFTAFRTQDPKDLKKVEDYLPPGELSADVTARRLKAEARERFAPPADSPRPPSD